MQTQGVYPPFTRSIFVFVPLATCLSSVATLHCVIVLLREALLRMEVEEQRLIHGWSWWAHLRFRFYYVPSYGDGDSSAVMLFWSDAEEQGIPWLS